MFKRLIFNASDVGADCNVRYVCASIERLIPDVGDAVGDYDAGYVHISKERKTSDVDDGQPHYGIRDDYILVRASVSRNNDGSRISRVLVWSRVSRQRPIVSSDVFS